MGLSKKDYVKILNYYKMRIPSNKKTLKKRAENVLAIKLCRCIKKVDPKDEEKAIGVCSRSIFNKKGLTRGKFKCKKGTRKVSFKKQQVKTKTIKKISKK